MNATTRRLLSTAFAALMTLGMLASIDHLARIEPAAAAATLAAAATPRV